MKALAIIALSAILGGCAACERHPIACTVAVVAVTAVAVGIAESRRSGSGVPEIHRIQH